MNEHIQKMLKNRHSSSLLEVEAESRTNEIDLFELLFRLWNNKRLIITVTMVITLIASIYAFTAKEQWTAKTYISNPRIAQISEYLELRGAFYRVSGTESDGQIIAQRLFNEFTSMAFSPNEKRSYLSNTKYFIEQSQGMDDRSQRQLLNEMTEKQLIIEAPDEKQNPHYFTISMTANDPLLAQSLLESYLNQVNEKVIQQDDSEFRHIIADVIASRKKERKDIAFSLKAEKNNQLENLASSLNTAQKAEIKDYYVNSGEKGNTKIEIANTVKQYMLGEKFLSAEIQSLQNSPIIYPVRYYEIERELTMLESLLLQRATAQAFCYQLSPGDYIQKDRPKRVLIIILGGLLGFMIGVGIVLLGNSIKYFQRNTK